MALAPPFLSTAKTLPYISSSHTFCIHKTYVRQNVLVPLCKIDKIDSQLASSSSPPCMSKRSFALSLSSAFLLSLAGNGWLQAEAAPLEDEDDLELLEKVKKDRKKRIERQGIINSSTKEKGYLQDLVYKLSEVGQDIEKNDLNAAKSVLGTSTDTDWIKKANAAFTKLSLGDEEKEEVDMFNTSISKLISSVAQQDIESSKIAFVTSASAFEKWTTLTGLDGILKGL